MRFQQPDGPIYGKYRKPIPFLQTFKLKFPPLRSPEYRVSQRDLGILLLLSFDYVVTNIYAEWLTFMRLISNILWHEQATGSGTCGHD